MKRRLENEARIRGKRTDKLVRLESSELEMIASLQNSPNRPREQFRSL